jgi:mono/diheme cytochrome c family protein
MATRRTDLTLHRLAALCFLAGLGALQLTAPTPTHAQAGSSESPHPPPPGQSAPAASGSPTARELFRHHCHKCHGSDGTGSPARDTLPKIPDFTKTSWQAQRSDAQLLASVLDGKGPAMPSWRGKIGEEQTRGLVAHVRAFAPNPRTPKSDSTAGFNERFQRLLRANDRFANKDAQGVQGFPGWQCAL